MDDLFFPFIYQQPDPEISEQISLYIEDLPIIIYKEENEEERVAIIEIL